MEETESGNWVASWGTSVVRVRISRWFGGSLVSRTRPGKVRAPCVALVRSTIKGTRGATSDMCAIKLGTKQYVFVRYKGAVVKSKMKKWGVWLVRMWRRQKWRTMDNGRWCHIQALGISSISQHSTQEAPPYIRMTFQARVLANTVQFRICVHFAHREKFYTVLSVVADGKPKWWWP